MGRLPGVAVVCWLIASLVAIAGWRQFWFLTDDAFITFRYASNWMQGLGFVWNPPPFLPVEGYSNFSWLVLLTGVWAITGIEPPVAANPLSLLCGLGTLGLTTALLWRNIGRSPPAWRAPLLIVALLFLVTAPTFLTWLSSGLETALWNALIVWWVLEAVRAPERADAIPRLCAAAAALALTRPDGLGFWIATLAMIVAVKMIRGAAGAEVSRAGWAGSIAWLALPFLHLAWRRFTYDAWLPNTYHAKIVAPWPEMGLRYLASFVIELGVWWWALAMLGAGLLVWRRRSLDVGATRRAVVPSLMVATLVAHIAYYVLVVGGDHFEYRVFSHALPLLVASLLAALGAAAVSAPRQLAILAVFWLVSLPIPWAHWAETEHLNTRLATAKVAAPLAHRFPAPIHLGVARWDALQAYMIERMVGTRRITHDIFHRFQVARSPSREEGSRITWDERRLLAIGPVGVPGWVLPQVAILDGHGLNDRVVARAPVTPSPTGRRMAHERTPPPEYMACLAPEFTFRAPGPRMMRTPLPRDAAPGRIDGMIRVPEPRGRTLTDERIRDCESRTWYP